MNRKKAKELISLIVPVFQVETYVERCIQSIVHQTYDNLEIILVDDGSKDRSGKICDEWARKDKRIRVIHKENGGLSSARNAGLEAASGDYVGFVDSDDFILPDMYARLYERLIDNNLDLVMCNFVRVDEQGNPLEKGPSQEQPSVQKYTRREMMEMFLDGRCTIAELAWNKLYKRKLFDGIRFPDGKICEDEYIMHEILGKCPEALFLTEKLYCYTQRSNSLTGAKYTVRNLTHIEACGRRIDYYSQNGFQDLCPKAAKLMLDHYLALQVKITPRSWSDLKRYGEIRKMVRQCCKQYGEGVSLGKRALFHFPVLLQSISWIARKAHLYDIGKKLFYKK